MQGDPQVTQCLEVHLKNELTAINQYFVHDRMFKHGGFERMAKKACEESIGEMKHRRRADGAFVHTRHAAQPAGPGQGDDRRDLARGAGL